MGKIKITEDELKQIIRESVLQEWGFDNRWRNKNANRQNAYNNALDYYNKINSPNTTGVTSRDKRQADKQLVRAISRNGEGFAKRVQELEAANQNLTTQNTQLQEQVAALQGQIATLTGERDKLNKQVSGLQKTINTLKTQIAQQTTTAQQQQTAAANQQTAQRPQTMMAETKEEGIGDTVKTAAQKVRNTTRNTLGKVKKTVNNTKQVVGNAAKSWVDKRDAHDKVMSSNPNSTLANNYINKF